MTRVNVIPVSELSQRHLIAEKHEIVRVFALARNAQNELHKRKIPSEYTLGTGHVTFFFPRLKYISDRYDALCTEMTARGYTCNRIPKEELHQGIRPGLFQDYVPTDHAIKINRERIDLRTKEAAEKAQMKNENKKNATQAR